MRRSRKADTATSFAALSMVGADPPVRKTSRAKRSAGKRSGSGASKVNEASRARSSRSAGVSIRSGQARAWAMGQRMSGLPNCAKTEPSTYSTIE